MDLSSGALKRQNFSIGRGSFGIEQIHSEFEVLFEVAQSQRRIITSEDLGIPPSTNEEAELEKQEYISADIKGFDDSNEWAFVRRRLQELKTNPYITHVKYFADYIEDHFKHMKKGIGFPISIKQWKQLKKLKELKKEAKRAIANEKVTYKWWIEFNEKLAGILSNTEKTVSNKFQKGLIISLFPLKMAIPTKKDSLGIMTFNRAGTEEVYPLGLINNRFREEDPYWFIDHDEFHTFAQLRKDLSPCAGCILFRKKILEVIRSMPLEKRKKAEWAYFYMDHEEQYYKLFPDVQQKDSRFGKKNFRQKIEGVVSNGIVGNPKGFLSVFKGMESADVNRDIYAFTDLFIEAYDQALSFYN